MTERDFTWDGEHTICRWYNCTNGTYIILLTDVTPVNSIKFFKEKSKFDLGILAIRGKTERET